MSNHYVVHLKFIQCCISIACMHARWLQLCPTLCDPMDYSPLGSSSVQGDSPGKNTGLGCHALLQEIFLTQGLNPPLLHLLHWQVDCLPLVPSYIFIKLEKTKTKPTNNPPGNKGPGSKDH